MSPRRNRYRWLKILLAAASATLLIAHEAGGQNKNGAATGAPARGVAAPQAAKQAPPGQEKYKADEVLVRFRKGVPGARASAAHRKLGGHVLHTYPRIEGLQLVRIPPSMTVEDAMRKYQQNPDVLYAEPNYYVHAVLTPDDARFSEQWGLNNTGQTGGTLDADIDAPGAWELTTGDSSVVVAVIDSGVDYNHPDLAANIWSNPSDCISNGVDDDGNGYIDDCHGIDTINNDSDPVDDNGHGTHVSGIIGAASNNALGVAGVNWHVSILACKFLDKSGNGYLDGAIACLDYVATMKDLGVNILASNNSWEGGSFTQALYDAIEANRARGILFFVAAGNGGGDGIGDNNDSLAHYPSNYYAANLVAVAATDHNDARGSFSNYGRRTVHLGAPGVGILSTTGGSYASWNGTSMATPFVTGVAALLKAYDSSLDWKQIKNRILAGGDTVAAMTGTTITGKRLNAYGALACSNSVVLSRLRPIGSTFNGTAGVPVYLSALHINCGAPNGRVRVSVAPIGVTVNLMDDGLGWDEEAGDGIYSGQFTPYAAGTYTLTFPGGDAVTLQVAPALRGYEYEATTFSYRDISTTGSNLNLGDETSTSFTSPFAVPFGGGGFSTLYVGDDGVISFSNAYTSWNNYQIPTTQVQTLVAPFWEDFVPASATGNNIFWGVLGSSPSRELVIEWRDLKCFGCFAGDTAKFQVVFFEDKSDVLFNYADVYFGPSESASNYGKGATVGIQVSTTSGRQYSYNTASLSDSSAIRWWTRSVAVAPSSLDFAEELLGVTSGSQAVTVTNNGGGPVTLSSLGIVGGNSGDFSQSHDCPLSPSTLATGAHCTIDVTFSPSVGGPRRSTLSIAHDVAGSPSLVRLAGLGAAVGLSATSLTFAGQQVGTASAPQTVTLTNHGTAPVSFFDLAVMGVNSGDFAPSSDCPLAPATLAGAATCTVSVVFTPSATGPRSGLLLMSHDGGGSPDSVTLAGTGD